MWPIIVTFIFTMLSGTPIVFVIGLASLIYMLISGLPLELIPQRMFVGVDQFVLMAVPFFMLAGNIMNYGGLTKRLIKFCNVIIGNVRGGLAYVNIFASMIFAGITGSATADTSSIGSILIPAMKEEGYSADFSAAVTAASSTIGGIIPPSIPFVIYAVTAGGVSVAGLFLGGIIPGILIGLFQMALVLFYSYKGKCPPAINKSRRLSLKEIHSECRDAILALIMPIIMIGGILSGIFTPTEASAVSCVYALVVSLFVYKEITISDLPKIILSSGLTTGACFMIVAVAAPFGWVLSAEMVPQKMANMILSLTDNPNVILLLIIMLLLFLGTFMETIAAIIVITPVLLPLAANLGLNPIHFGLIVCIGIYIGLITPPVGICLYIASTIAKISLEEISKAIIPFILLSVLVLLIVAYFPSAVLFIPNLFLR
ncbi:MAG TPA: TRAP transporter large permease [Candidatus Atribacteria bacterium]|nr:TRAP transporter large permease [Candidatus Atribacteria bacterium]